MNQLFIAPNGTLQVETKIFRKACHQVTGIHLQELWCDSYQLNLKNKDAVLFPSDFLCPFEVTEHADQEEEFIRKGGGFRLDLDWFT